MDMIQLAIIAVVVVLILVTIGYYLYQEAKFKRMVENNFNQATNDVITEENRAFTLDGIDMNKAVATSNILQKDVASPLPRHEHSQNSDPLFDMQEAAVGEHPKDEPAALFTDDANHAAVAQTVEEMPPPEEIPVKEEIVHPENSVEAFFANIHKVVFPYANEVNPDLDFIVDIGFEEAKKIKVLPDITQFTNKPFKFYVLDKSGNWSVFARGEKYTAQALKLVLQLVDHEGIISQAQLSNIFNELHKFVMQNEAHIYRSDYEASICKIQNQIKHLEKIELNLNLFMITQQEHLYSDLVRFFSGLGLIDTNGSLQLSEHGHPVFKISAEHGASFVQGRSYNLLQVSAELHKQKDPNHTVEKIFDCAEKVMQGFEARLLTSNKHILGQKDYDAIVHHVKRYADNAKANGIELGGELIRRVF